RQAEALRGDGGGVVGPQPARHPFVGVGTNGQPGSDGLAPGAVPIVTSSDGGCEKVNMSSSGAAAPSRPVRCGMCELPLPWSLLRNLFSISASSEVWSAMVCDT